MNADGWRAMKFRRIAGAGGGDDLLLASVKWFARTRPATPPRTRDKENFFHIGRFELAKEKAAAPKLHRLF